MRYPAAEKLEIIRLVEQSPLPVRHTLVKLGIPRATFYRWYDRYSRGGPEALNDRSPRPDRVWNRIPDGVRDNLIQLALDQPALSPRELAVRFTDTESYFVSEASVYRLLKARDLIARRGLPSRNGDQDHTGQSLGAHLARDEDLAGRSAGRALRLCVHPQTRFLAQPRRGFFLQSGALSAPPHPCANARVCSVVGRWRKGGTASRATHLHFIYSRWAAVTGRS